MTASVASYPMKNILSAPRSEYLYHLGLILLGSLIIALSAYTRIPLIPVPVTLQTAAVLLIGMIYGPWLGGLTVSAYLCEGIIGLPVFATGQHFGPVLGYLLGFIPAAIVSGWLMQKGCGRHWFTAFFAGAVGIVIIFTLGVTDLANFVGWQHAVDWGLKPFVVTEPLKLLAVSLIAPRFWK